ncbi:hypothetical protein CCMSSC00406_0001652 [Pleurotus cornucopiae]|uniref:Uncharacterized protein n=1 Tax=Pleurotus cornucopiae TaxID=5321 RepID=A0ACB7ILZ4_PLECO|nr:hypothetical protein CCMSSC00406_0001652 [Pleurotus cornucopiae]
MQPQPTPSIETRSSSTEGDSERLDNALSRTKRPTLGTHIAILAAFMTPFVCVPYLLMRRRLTSMARTVSELELTIRQLRRESSLTTSQLIAARDSQQKSIDQALKDINGLSTAQTRSSARSRAVVDDALIKQLGVLTQIQTHNRDTATILRSLGVSLADIASFIQKLQLEHGYQTKSGTSEEVDALRMVALRLQTLPELADTRASSR